MKAIDHALNSLRELIEICRVKCGPHDEVILPGGRTNHDALIDAVEALDHRERDLADIPQILTRLMNWHDDMGGFEAPVWRDLETILGRNQEEPDDDDLPGQFLASVARSMARNQEGGAK